MDVLIWLRAQADRVLGFVLVAAGAVALVIGYEKAADTRYLAEQMTVLISGGLGGLFCLGAGATLLVCADIRDEWRKLDRIETVLVHMSDALGLPPPPGPAPAPGGGGRGQRRSSPAVMAAALVIMAAGGIVVAGGWQASASTTTGSKAIDAAGWSSAGLVVAAIGAVALIVSLKRAVRLRQAAVLSPVALYGAWQDAGLRMAVSSRPAVAEPAGTVRYAAGLRHFHRPGCAAVAGLATDTCPRAVAAGRLQPCPLCEP
ncbi:MAG TPA: hypothetical protein VFE55_11375 [Acidimicrobiia bacterium]|nr:hypothetical protein [Acidimicrobiia bacterium]